MPKYRYALIFPVFIVLIGMIIGCKVETIELTDSELGISYFPDRSGYWIEYKIDSVIYDKFTDSVYLHQGYLRQVWDSSFVDNEGRAARRMASYYRQNLSDPFNIHPPVMSYFIKTADKVEIISQNLRTISLVFPIINDKKWNGNSYIASEYEDYTIYNDWLFYYTKAGLPANINGIAFPKTTTIIQNDYENLIQRIYAEEVYADGVGLISKKWSDLKLQTSDLGDYVGIEWPDRANQGVDITWQIIAHQ